MAQVRLSLLDLLDSEHAELVKQGAEAKVYKAPLFIGSSTVPSIAPAPVLLKHRFPKAYRHPSLDSQLTKSRIGHESRCLVRAARYGVTVPGVRAVDVESGVVAVEWVEGWSVREVLGGGAEGDEIAGEEEDESEGGDSIEEGLQKLGLRRDHMLALIGTQLALLHLADIVHGDLTTSNMMLRVSPSHPSSSQSRSALLSSPAPTDGTPLPWEVVLIDFGLSYVSTMVEDKAVDLYVLERAFSSTHPEPLLAKGDVSMYGKIEEAYANRLGPKEWVKVRRRLEDVRLRGRKRSMVG